MTLIDQPSGLDLQSLRALAAGNPGPSQNAGEPLAESNVPARCPI